MKEIKFRVYDNEKGRYEHLSFSIYKVNMIDQDPSRWTFLQYTGLKDKNGKEIYEGDILRADWGKGTPPLTVIYEDAAFMLTMPEDPDYRDMVGEENNDYMEVIGNIYQELLET